VILDEAAYLRSEVWHAVLRPTLADRQGRALFLSTPAGRNWFWQLWLRGKNPDYDNWQSWNFPTAANPLIPRTEIEQARASLPDRVFRQEWLAEFIESSSAVFRGIDQAVDEPTSPDEHRWHRLVMGLDWGKHEDFTVITVVCINCGRMVDWARFNRIDYEYQMRRVCDMIDKWQPIADTLLIVPERNAMGEPLVDRLRAVTRCPVWPFLTTATSKSALIESLALAIERAELKLLPNDILLDELRTFTVELNRNTGRPRYGALPGFHDDCVISLALAWHGAVRGGGQVRVYDENPLWS